MLASFFESVLQLVVRTSTDLPPDVRAAMKTALDSEPSDSRASQALTIIAQNIDLAVDTDIRNQGPGRCQSDLDA
jgi:fumarate hydratase class I